LTPSTLFVINSHSPMSVDIWDDRALELSFSWLHGPHDSRLLGTWEAMIAGSVLYVIVIAIFSYAMRQRRAQGRPVAISLFVLIQNLVMGVYSLYAFWGTTMVILRLSKQPGWSWRQLMCDPSHAVQRSLDFWFYHFYLSKFLEWFDTIFLALRGKPIFPPLTSQYFLHVFHHLVTPSIVWIAWRVPFSTAWVGPFSNGFVHVFMYFYYFLTELGMNRKYGGMFITPIQLVQFIVALSLITFETLHVSECNSTPWAIAWMWFTYGVFLLFFLKLYFDKKQERSGGRAPRKEDKKKED